MCGVLVAVGLAAMVVARRRRAGMMQVNPANGANKNAALGSRIATGVPQRPSAVALLRRVSTDADLQPLPEEEEEEVVMETDVSH